MAEATIVSESPKTRLDLAIILKVYDYDINQAADEVVRILNLEEDKRHFVYSLMSKVSFNFRKSKKSIESLDGVYISYSSHAFFLFDRLLKQCVLNFPAPHFYPLTLKIKHRLDGSGPHSSPGLLSDLNIDRSNYIVFMVSPLQVIDQFGNVLWEKTHPNSCFSNQPVALICQKETIDTVIELSKSLNPEIISLNENCFDRLNGHVKVEVIASMFDGKTLATMTGLFLLYESQNVTATFFNDDYLIVTSSKFTLSCLIGSVENFTEFFFESYPLKNFTFSRNHSLFSIHILFTEFSTSDTAKYSCRNQYGIVPDLSLTLFHQKSVPLFYPHGFDVEDIGSLYISLRWSDLNLQSNHRFLAGFVVSYHKFNSSHISYVHNIKGFSYNLVSLCPSTLYEISISAVNSFGIAMFSPSLSVRTLPSGE
ncbi:hypothetical protein LOD99_15167 [Oopsacas minuta]|uniref:Fibronectin type-III domain-containing protein n=1 Tax=Oopsacas minuta TaxID=111878 RepID=A0AAV7KCE8_9METZ|nr:hypothetical protein LOD99_15167 [Oopsacas minuta]